MRFAAQRRQVDPQRAQGVLTGRCSRHDPSPLNAQRLGKGSQVSSMLRRNMSFVNDNTLPPNLEQRRNTLVLLTTTIWDLDLFTRYWRAFTRFPIMQTLNIVPLCFVCKTWDGINRFAMKDELVGSRVWLIKMSFSPEFRQTRSRVMKRSTHVIARR